MPVIFFVEEVESLPPQTLHRADVSTNFNPMSPSEVHLILGGQSHQPHQRTIQHLLPDNLRIEVSCCNAGSTRIEQESPKSRGSVDQLGSKLSEVLVED